MSLKAKLITTCLGVGLISSIVIGMIAWNVATDAMDTVSIKGTSALEEAAFAQLTAMREVKERQVGLYFAERISNLNALVEFVGSLPCENLEKSLVHKTEDSNKDSLGYLWNTMGIGLRDRRSRRIEGRA